MPKTRKQKEQIVSDLTEKIQNGESAVFVGFSGLKVADLQEFRKKCRENEAEYVVARKSLMKIALSNAGADEVDPTTLAENEMGVILSYGDAVSGAKVAKEFAKEHEALTLLGGLMLKEKKVLDINQVKALADIPPREVLLGQLVGSLAAPMSGFVGVLQGNTRNLVYALNAIKESKE